MLIDYQNWTARATHVRDPITAPFENIDPVVETFLKLPPLMVEIVVGDLIEPVIERCQKGIEASQPILFDAPHPVGDCVRGRLLDPLDIGDGAQLFAQAVGLAQFRHAFQQHREHMFGRTLYREVAESGKIMSQKFCASGFLWESLGKVCGVKSGRLFGKLTAFLLL